MNHYINVTWLPFNKDKPNCLLLGNELLATVIPDQEKMELWDNLYNKYYKIWDQPKSNGDANVEVTVSKTPEPESAPQIVEDTATTVVTKSSHSEVVESHVTIVETTTVTEEHNDVVENNVQELVDVTDNTPPEPPKVESVIKENNVHEQKHESVVGADESINVQEKIAHHEQMKATTNGGHDDIKLNGNGERKPRPSNEIKMVQPANFDPKDVIRANDPPEDDLPKNIGVNKFVNFFESLGGKK